MFVCFCGFFCVYLSEVPVSLYARVTPEACITYFLVSFTLHYPGPSPVFVGKRITMLLACLLVITHLSDGVMCLITSF